MSLDTLIAILGLAAAVYALLPRARRLDLRLHLRKSGWFVILLALVVVHILVFYPSLHHCQIFPKWPFHEKSLNPGQVAYLVVLAAVAFVAIKISFATLHRADVFRFGELVEELIHSEGYAELFSLIDRNLEKLCRIKDRDFLIVFTELLSKMQEQPQSDPKFWERLCFRLKSARSAMCRRLSRLLPTYQRHSDAAANIIHQVLASQRVVNAVVQLRPYLGLRLLTVNVYEKGYFLDRFIRKLLEERHSILYFELRSNRNIGSKHNYWLPESNRLLHYFFADARRAEGLGVWKPVGDFVISRLDELAVNAERDPYNAPVGEFHDRTKWEDPIFISVFFFDVMVSSALHQGITSHMWLYYFPYFVERIVRNYKCGPLVDPFTEWPTRYSYLLYSIIDALTDWMEAAQHIPQDQQNVQIRLDPGEPESGNIPKSAAFALTDCMRGILLAEQIPEQFRHYLVNIVFRTYFQLRADPNTEGIAEVLRCRLGERSYRNVREDQCFLNVLQLHFAKCDKIPYRSEHVKEIYDVFLNGWQGWVRASQEAMT